METRGISSTGTARNGGMDSSHDDPLLAMRAAIANDASMTKDLEEQLDNIDLAEQITRRSSTDSLLARLHDHDPSSVSAKQCNLPIAALAPRAKSGMIEKLPATVPRSSGRLSRSPTRRCTETMTTMTTTTATTTTTTAAGAPKHNGNSGFTAAWDPSTLVKSPNGRYPSLLANVDPVKRTRGSLTSSDDDEEDNREGGSSIKKFDAVDPAVSFSSSGATVVSFSTQTPEEMNSSDSDHTNDDEEEGRDQQPIREPSSSGSSSSESENWDSEADTHTSPSDDDDTERGKKPVAQYYQVSDVPKTPLGQEGRSAAVARVNPRPAPPPAGRMTAHTPGMPWLQRPAFTSMQFPAATASSHPRRGVPAMPTSQSFPQDFFRMVSNPFFTTSLHDAYRQACAFKEWYETNFPDQIGMAGAVVDPQLHRKSSSTVSFPSSRRTSNGSHKIPAKADAFP